MDFGLGGRKIGDERERERERERGEGEGEGRGRGRGRGREGLIYFKRIIKVSESTTLNVLKPIVLQ